MEVQLPALPYDAGNLRWELQTSGDLMTWSTVAMLSPGAAGTGGPTVVLPSAVRQYFRVNAVLW